MSSEEEFLQAVGEHLGLVSNQTRRLSAPAQVEDLGAGAYLRRCTAGGTDRVRAWLAAIGQHLARAGRRRDQARLVEVLDPLADTTVACGHDTIALAISGAVGDQVHRALWQLPTGKWEAIALMMMELCGFTAAEVAAPAAYPLAPASPTGTGRRRSP